MAVGVASDLVDISQNLLTLESLASSLPEGRCDYSLVRCVEELKAKHLSLDASQALNLSLTQVEVDSSVTSLRIDSLYKSVLMKHLLPESYSANAFSLFSQALENNDIDRLIFLFPKLTKTTIRKGFIPLIKDQPKDALESIIKGGHYKILEALLSKDFLSEEYKEIALMFAVEEGNLRLVDLLTRSPDLSDEAKGMAFVAACKNGHRPIISHLLQNGCILPDRLRNEAIQYTCWQGCLETLKDLLVIGGPMTKEIKESVIITAVERGHLSIVLFLLENSGEIDPMCLSNALRQAIINGGKDVALYLFKLCPPNTVEEREHLISLAAANGHIELIRLLKEDTISKDVLYAAFRSAARGGHTDVVKFLLEEGNFDEERIKTMIVYDLIHEACKPLIYSFVLEKYNPHSANLKKLKAELVKCKKLEIKSCLMGLFGAQTDQELESMFSKLGLKEHIQDYSCIALLLNSFPQDVDKKSLLQSIIKHHKTLFKDNLKREVLIKTLLSLHHVQRTDKYKILEHLLTNLTNSEDIKNALALLCCIAESNPVLLEKIDISAVSLDSLISLLVDDLKQKKFIDASADPKKLIEILFQLRNPGAFFSYIVRIAKEHDMKDSLISLIESLLTGTFIASRNARNSHGSFLTPEMKSTWERSFEEEGAEDSDDFNDLLLCGTEAGGSCQSVYDDTLTSKCLMGYVLDGKVRILKIKNKQGKMLSRAMLKIVLLPNNTPALYLGGTYGVTSDAEKIHKLAIKKAKAMGIPLFVQGSGETLRSLSNVAPYEYDDEANDGVIDGVPSGITRGNYTCRGRRVDI